MNVRSVVTVILWCVLFPVICFASEDQKDINRLFSNDYLAADYAIRHQEWDSAAMLSVKMLRERPGDISLLDQAIRSFLYAGNITEALVYSKHLLNIKPGDNLAYLLVTLDALKQKKFSETTLRLQTRIDSAKEHAKQEHDEAKTSMEDLVFPYLLLWSKAGEKHYAEAIAQAEMMRSTEDKNNEYFLYFQIALLADLAGDIEKAKTYFEKALMTPSRSYVYTRAAGNFYERLGNAVRAKEIYTAYQLQHLYMGYFSRDIARINHGQLATQRVITDADEAVAEIFSEIGNMLFGAQIYLPSVAYLQMVLWLMPHHQDATIILSAYYAMVDQYDKTSSAYHQIPSGSDIYYPVRIYLAEHLYRHGRKSLAIKKLLTLSKYKPVHYFALITLGDLLRKDNHFNLAVAVYTQVINGIAEPESAHWMLFFARGICYERMKQWKKSEDDLLMALRLNPDQPDVLNYLGYSWVDQGVRTQEAKAMIEKAIIQRPEDPQFIDSMGWIFYRLKDYPHAGEYIEKALEFSPQDAVVNDHLGDVYWQQGRYEEARFQWRKALKYKPDTQNISHIQCKIDEGLPCSR